MRKGRLLGAAAAAAALFLAAYVWLPHPVESVLGYSLDAPRVGIMMVLSEMSESKYFELDDQQRAAVHDVLSAVRLQRTMEKGDVIFHRDGFGWYQIILADEDSQKLWPDISVDSDGDVFIDNVKHEIADEQKKTELMELLATICER